MLAVVLHIIGAPGNIDLAGTTKTNLATPLIEAGQYLIPAGVAMSGLHKLLSHQESGAGFLTDVLVKGGGAWLLIQVIRIMANI